MWRLAAYLNLEPVHGPYAGESASVEALRASGVARVVVGLLHPLARLRRQAVAALQAAGLQVCRPLTRCGAACRSGAARGAHRGGCVMSPLSAKP
jgi:pyrimidine deaminase RibD-like protein